MIMDLIGKSDDLTPLAGREYMKTRFQPGNRRIAVIHEFENAQNRPAWIAGLPCRIRLHHFSGSAIPFNFLTDRSGVIVCKNPYGDELMKKLYGVFM
jgi:hypothetical protein